MVGRRLVLGDDEVFIESEAESDSQQGSNSERGDDPKVTFVRALEHAGSSTRRVSKAAKPSGPLDLEF